jgi:hypothetical protein
MRYPKLPSALVALSVAVRVSIPEVLRVTVKVPVALVRELLSEYYSPSFFAGGCIACGRLFWC